LGLSISKRLVSLMQGNMWVESEVAKGSKFFFTITSQISQSTMEATLGKMAPFAKRTILFVDTLRDTTGVVDRIKDLGLRPFTVHEVFEVSDKERCPHIDTIVVDSIPVVCFSPPSLSLVNCVHYYYYYFRRNAYANMSICDTSQLSSSHPQCLGLIVSTSFLFFSLLNVP
jgi:hypothetical protein